MPRIKMPRIKSMGTAIALGLLLAWPVEASAAEQACKQFKKEMRVGSGLGDTYETRCRERDGTWRVQGKAGDVSGTIIQTPPSQSTHTGSSSTRYFTDSDSNTSVVVEDGVPAYVIVNPDGGRYYRGRGGYGYYGGGRNWSPEKQSFHQYHHNPGWEKHWQHHQKYLGGTKPKK